MLLRQGNLKRGTTEQRRWANTSNVINTDRNSWHGTEISSEPPTDKRTVPGKINIHAAMPPRNPQNVGLLNDDDSGCPNAGYHKISQNLWATSKFQAPQRWQKDSSILDDPQIRSDLLCARWPTHAVVCKGTKPQRDVGKFRCHFVRNILSVINQLNAQILFYNKFIVRLYMFRALLCSPWGGQNCITQYLVSSHSVNVYSGPLVIGRRGEI